MSGTENEVGGTAPSEKSNPELNLTNLCDLRENAAGKDTMLC